MESLPPLSFWLAAVGVPLGVVAGNALVRVATKVPQSGAADVVLTLAIFDVLVVIQHSDFEPYIHSVNLQQNILSIYTLLIVLGMLFWALAVFFVEKRISEYQKYKIMSNCNTSGCTLKGNQQIKFPRIGYLASLCIPFMQLAGSLGPFVFR